jgi:hypothetical protein
MKRTLPPAGGKPSLPWLVLPLVLAAAFSWIELLLRVGW